MNLWRKAIWAIIYTYLVNHAELLFYCKEFSSLADKIEEERGAAYELFRQDESGDRLH
ncbi:hypothetical protein [Fumia xinanensis]|uniref:Uncharacterized protein n=1 Tax=Fumia xinanensis TaxID=2763659 RepID=A0A926I5Q0_9FIRM|nr:hypothetical protein [Fumia xinanensis]MBC8559110.1 hypothetical protein [Fumia xinanensis]